MILRNLFLKLKLQTLRRYQAENQILLDFELPFSENKENEKEISNNLNKKQEIITEDANLDNNDLQESSMDVEFELKNSLKDNTENKKIEDTVEKIFKS